MKQQFTPKRRVLMGVGLGAVSVLALAGCSGGGGATETDGPVTLSVAIQGQDSGKKYYTELFDQLEEMLPDVSFNITEYPSDQLGTVLSTQFAANNAPDIVYGSPGTGNSNSLGLYADKGFLLDLSDQDWATASIPESSTSLFTNGDEQFAIPLDTVVVPLTINKTAYDKAGLTIPTTYDEFLANCAGARDAGAALVNIPGTFPANAAFSALEIAATRVYQENPDWNTDRADGTTTFADTPGWIETFEDVQEMYESGCMQDGAEGAGGPQIFPSVASGETLGMFGPSAVSSGLIAADSNNTYLFTAFPPVEASDAYVFASPSDAFGINANTKYPEVAKQVLEAMTDADVRNEFAAAAGNVSLESTLNGAATAPEFAEISDLLTDQAKSGPLPSFSWPNGNVYAKLGEGVQGLMTGQVTPEALAQAMDAAWDGQ